MLPGIIRQGQGPRCYGYYKKHEIVAVNLTSNKAAIGIGLLSKSSDDLYMSGGVGVGVHVLHVFGDKLWGLDASVCQQVPFLGAGLEMPGDEDFPALGETKSKVQPQQTQQPIVKQHANTQARSEEFPMLGSDLKRKTKAATTTDTAAVTEKLADLCVDERIEENIPPTDNQDEDGNGTDDDNVDEPDEINHDELLQAAFLTALKRDGKSLQLPLLTSTFYRRHVLPASEQPIDLKKTSHKKLSKFLLEMASSRFITVKEEQKGIEKITQVNLNHPDLLDFIPKPMKDNNAETKNNLFVKEMTELYLVTDATARFFASFNVANGDGLESSQIKKMLKEYVCNNKLQSPLNPRIIRINETLCTLCNRELNASVPFEELLSYIMSKMTHSFEMRSKNEVTKSSKNPTIQMSLATRSGNKKVTLVSNLEAYGIRLNEFEKACKLGVAASTTVTKLPYQKGEQLLVQGNQVRFIYKLLTETYKIPGKNIIGLDLAKKEKKVKK